MKLINKKPDFIFGKKSFYIFLTNFFNFLSGLFFLVSSIILWKVEKGKDRLLIYVISIIASLLCILGGVIGVYSIYVIRYDNLLEHQKIKSISS